MPIGQCRLIWLILRQGSRYEDRVQPSPNNQSKGALREWSGNSEHSAIGSNYQILSTPVQHRCSDFDPVLIKGEVKEKKHPCGWKFSCFRQPPIGEICSDLPRHVPVAGNAPVVWASLRAFSSFLRDEACQFRKPASRTWSNFATIVLFDSCP